MRWLFENLSFLKSCIPGRQLAFVRPFQRWLIMLYFKLLECTQCGVLSQTLPQSRRGEAQKKALNVPRFYVPLLTLKMLWTFQFGRLLLNTDARSSRYLLRFNIDLYISVQERAQFKTRLSVLVSKSFPPSNCSITIVILDLLQVHRRLAKFRLRHQSVLDQLWPPIPSRMRSRFTKLKTRLWTCLKSPAFQTWL